MQLQLCNLYCRAESAAVYLVKTVTAGILAGDEMRRKKVLKVISAIALVAALWLTVGGVLNSFRYVELYDAEHLNREQLSQSVMLYSTRSEIADEQGKETELTYKVKKLAGAEKIEDITLDNRKMTLDSDVRSGKGRILILDDAGKTVYDRVLEDGKEEISLSPGKYSMYAVGRWFSGKLKFELNNN